MKQLKDILEASLLGDIDDNIANMDNEIKTAIEEWISKSYTIQNGDIEISDKPNSAGKYEVSSNAEIISLRSQIDSITNGMFVWSTVDGDFYCEGSRITSLEGCPRRLESGNFVCDRCTLLTSLEGAPEYVGGSFVCSWCGKLKNLKGSPKYVGYEYDCKGCGNLKSLEGCTKTVVGFYCIDCVSLLSLKHCPTKVLRDLDCSGCINLLNFDCAKTTVKNNFCCSGCYSLKDLSNAPKSVGNAFVGRRIAQFTADEFEDCTKIGGKVFT